MTKHSVYHVIDLFAGPGGLGEGFASLRHPKEPNHYVFKTVLSIEKDESAHRTLQLRHFYREFTSDQVPQDYYSYLSGDISLEALYQRYPIEAVAAQRTTWCCTLGEEDASNVKNSITMTLKNQEKWVLVGGPPCQAYSLAGRSRMMGMPDFDTDPRHFLYRQYLQILADHAPPIFVMENVKGLLSAKIGGQSTIEQILRDLSDPECAIYERVSGVGYKLYSLSEAGLKKIDADPATFVVKAEEYGIPQARHRIFIVGIRNDINIALRPLEKSENHSVRQVIGDLPVLRSRISKSPDSDDLWKQTLLDFLGEDWNQNGILNGLKDSEVFRERVIESIRNRQYKISSQDYSPPATLKEWYHDERLTALSSHVARSHMKSDLHRYMFATLFASINETSPKLSDFPEELLPAHKNADRGRNGEMFSDRFRVQLPDSPATTIMSHISKDGHYYIHYDPVQCRSLTVREAARLQTFPDNYVFEGTRTEQYHQVGNAVPPLLANKIAEVIYEVLEGMK